MANTDDKADDKANVARAAAWFREALAEARAGLPRRHSDNRAKGEEVLARHRTDQKPGKPNEKLNQSIRDALKATYPTSEEE